MQTVAGGDPCGTRRDRQGARWWQWRCGVTWSQRAGGGEDRRGRPGRERPLCRPLCPQMHLLRSGLAGFLWGGGPVSRAGPSHPCSLWGGHRPQRGLSGSQRGLSSSAVLWAAKKGALVAGTLQILCSLCCPGMLEDQVGRTGRCRCSRATSLSQLCGLRACGLLSPRSAGCGSHCGFRLWPGSKPW